MNVQPMLDLPVVDSVSSPVFEEKCKTAEQNSPDKSDPRFYRPELDCLRFVAFLLVFSCHSLHGFTKLSVAGAFLQHMAAGGAFGVDLFFILSAYLITELLRREKHLTGRVDVRAFYMRRILRIWPLYFAFLTFWFLVRRFTPTTFPLSAFMAFVLFSGNWYMVRAEVRSPFVSPVDPLWSVSVEEQFYLAWPLIVRFASRAELIVSAICLCIVSLIAQFVLLRAGVPHIAIWVNSLVHTGAIGVGVLSAVLLAGSTPRINRYLRFVMFGAALVLWGIADQAFHFADNHSFVSQGMMAFLSGITGAGLLFFSWLGAPRDGIPFLTNRAFSYLGRISYGLYVFHVAALQVVKYIWLKLIGSCYPWTRFAIALPIALTLSWASYRWYESPFLKLKRKFTQVHSGPA